MLIKKMNNQVARRLMNYLLEKGSYFSLTKYVYDNRYEKYYEKINDMFKEDINVDTITNNLEAVVDKIYDKYKNDEQIYKFFIKGKIYRIKSEMKLLSDKEDSQSNPKRYLKKIMEEEIGKLDELKTQTNDKINYNSKEFFKDIILEYIYHNRVSKFIDMYQDKIIKKLNEINNFGKYKDKQIVHAIIYVFVLDEEMKSVILSNPNPFCWEYPNFLEDLEIYDEKKILLSTIAHEGICDLYCDSEAEYRKFKSIGVKFFEEHFISEQYVKNDNYIYEEIKKDT